MKYHRSNLSLPMLPVFSIFLLALANPLSLAAQIVDTSPESSLATNSGMATVSDLSDALESQAAASQVGKPTDKTSDWDKGSDAWRFIVYPVYAWVPFFSSSVTLPEIPSPPGGGGGGGGGPVIPSGTTSGSFNGAAFAGAEVYKGKWEGMATVLYAGLSATRTTPKVTLDMNFVYGQAMVGREVYNGLAFEGGFRRMALDMTATVEPVRPLVERRASGIPKRSSAFLPMIEPKQRIHL